jgi:hypothetical protein
LNDPGTDTYRYLAINSSDKIVKKAPAGYRPRGEKYWDTSSVISMFIFPANVTTWYTYYNEFSGIFSNPDSNYSYTEACMSTCEWDASANVVRIRYRYNRNDTYPDYFNAGWTDNGYRYCAYDEVSSYLSSVTRYQVQLKTQS